MFKGSQPRGVGPVGGSGHADLFHVFLCDVFIFYTKLWKLGFMSISIDISISTVPTKPVPAVTFALPLALWF